MTPYRQYCPIAKAHEIIGGRWTVPIIRELVLGHENFNAIARGLPGISRSVLSERLRFLERHGVVARETGEARHHRYRLTEAGAALKPVIEAMGKWGAQWILDRPQEDELDPGLLLWRMRYRLNPDALPARRVVIHFEFKIGPRGRFWLMIENAQASVCLTDPGFDIDLVVTADLAAFYQLWLGRLSLEAAMASGAVRLEGVPAAERAFGSWLLWSPMAKFARPAGTAGDG